MERHGIKQKKTRLTYAFTVNAEGSDFRKPIVIGSAWRPRCFAKRAGTALGFDYHANAKAWMTMTLFEGWLTAWDAELGAQGRKVLLLLDNFSGHNIEKGKVESITLVRFAPNMTSHVQPLDCGIIRAFKAYYRQALMVRSVDRLQAGENDVYAINQLEAMRMAETAWGRVTRTTVVNCWRKSGILPQDSAPIVDECAGGDDVDATVDSLRASYALLAPRALDPNQDSIDQMVTPDGENDGILEEYTVSELLENMDVIIDNQGDVPDEEEADGSTLVQPHPKEVVQQIDALELALLFETGKEARAAEEVLARLRRIFAGRAQASLKQATIQDFFSRAPSDI